MGGKCCAVADEITARETFDSQNDRIAFDAYRTPKPLANKVKRIAIHSSKTRGKVKLVERLELAQFLNSSIEDRKNSLLNSIKPNSNKSVQIVSKSYYRTKSLSPNSTSPYKSKIFANSASKKKTTLSSRITDKFKSANTTRDLDQISNAA